jgi:flagella basal body P-ring formation protein FlgA
MSRALPGWRLWWRQPWWRQPGWRQPGWRLPGLPLLVLVAGAAPAMQAPVDVSAAVGGGGGGGGGGPPAPPPATLSVGPVAGAGYMRACPVPLTVTISGVAPYEQAAVHCAPLGWVLYVSVTVAAQEAVAVALRPVAAGATIAPGDVGLRQEPVGDFAGRQVFTDTQPLVGSLAVMNLSPGGIVTAQSVQPPVIVQAGQIVTVQVMSPGLVISVQAVANETGRLGETILMTNPASGRRFSALMTASGPVVRL